MFLFFRFPPPLLDLSQIFSTRRCGIISRSQYLWEMGLNLPLPSPFPADVVLDFPIRLRNTVRLKADGSPGPPSITSNSSFSGYSLSCGVIFAVPNVFCQGNISFRVRCSQPYLDLSHRWRGVPYEPFLGEGRLSGS